MGFRDFVSNSILRMDLLSAPPLLRTRKQPAYETIFGGLLSIVVLGAFYYFLYLQLDMMFNKLTITYSQGVNDNVDSTSTITEFPFAVAIDGVDLVATPKTFLLDLYQNRVIKNVGAPPTTIKTRVNLAKCN